jgi:membrane peptidoglycan carboxypeptidase
MKKIIKLIVFLIIIITLSASIPFVVKGYKMYTVALNEVSIEEKKNEIQSKESYTSLSELPQIYKDAVLAVEDHRYYKHGAIDIISIGRAIITDIKAKEYVEGGSTITQQLAKNLYFTQKKEIERKIAEIFMAYEMERTLDKDTILELYLNSSYFGNGYYTVKQASRGYFKKEPKEMTSYEATLLAGIPNAPSVYAPNKNLNLAKQRQKQVINKMVKYKYLTQEEANKILKED